MRVSARTEYALLALLELAGRKDAAPLQSRGISAATGVPKPFHDQLLLSLRRSGLVRSVRGPGGGYVLAKAPSDITLRDAIAAVEGGSLTTQCGIKSQDGSDCRKLPVCALLEVWKEVDSAIVRILSAKTLADLHERQRQLDGQQMYFI